MGATDTEVVAIDHRFYLVKEGRYEAFPMETTAQFVKLGEEEDAGDLAASLAQIDARLEALDIAAGEIAGLKANVAGHADTMATLQGGLESAGKDAAAKGEAITALTADLAAVKESATTLTADLAAAKENITTMSADMATAKESIVTLGGRLDTAEGNISTLTSDLAETKATIAGHTDSIAANAGKIATLESGLQQAQTALADLAGLAERVAALEAAANPDNGESTE